MTEQTGVAQSGREAGKPAQQITVSAQVARSRTAGVEHPGESVGVVSPKSAGARPAPGPSSDQAVRVKEFDPAISIEEDVSYFYRLLMRNILR